LSSEHPNSRDGTVIVFSIKTYRCKCIFLELLQALEHASNEIAAHENLSQFIIVFILSIPNGPVLSVQLLPEEGDGFSLSFIGIATLELI
jgi:hypothetical protein